QSVPAEEDRKRRAEARLVELQAAASQRPQLVEVSRQLEAAGQAEAEARARLPELERAAAEAEAQALRLRQAIEQHERQLAEHRAEVRRRERESPEEEAELAGAARELVAAEEARVDARLKVSALEGSLGLIRRDAELAAARMEELRSRMPAGLGPEEVPGGKAREREMRQLE